MPDEPKDKNVPISEDEPCAADQEKNSEHKERSYYYDDAHGYEQFDPDSDVDEREDN